MTNCGKTLALVGLLANFFIGFCSAPALAQSFSHPDLEADRVSWNSLSFSMKRFSVSVKVTIQLAALPTSEVESALTESPQGTPFMPATPQAFQIVSNIIIDPIFRSPVKLMNWVWFNAKDATALGRIRLDRGDDDQKKIFRFTHQGVFRHRIEPRDKHEAMAAPEKWTSLKDSFYPYDLTRLGCPSVSERFVLIYIISAAADLLGNQPLSLCVFGKRQLHHVQLRMEGKHLLKVDYSEKSQGNEMRIKKMTQAAKIALYAEPVESDLAETEDFSFLGLHKDIAIYIDPVTALPIRITGIIPTVGKVELNLHEAWLKN